MHILKAELFYPPVDDGPTRFRNFFDVKITIFYEQTLYFSLFFRRRHIEFLHRQNSILALNSERTHLKIVGHPFQDELLMIQLFFTKFEIRKKILDFWAFMG